MGFNNNSTKMANFNSIASPQNVTAHLEHIVGSNLGKRIPLYEQNVIIGRSKNANVCIEDPNISRSHCSLKYTSNGWLIKDMGSVNGTYVDDVVISVHKYHPLKDKCCIYFGPSEDAPAGLRFEKVKLSKGTSESETLKKRLENEPSSPQRASGSRTTKRKACPVDATKSKNSEKKYLTVDIIGVPSSHNFNFLSSNEENCAEDGYHSESSVSSLDSLKTRIRKANSSQKKGKRAKFCNGEEDFNVKASTNKKLFEIQPSIERMYFQSNSAEEQDSLSLLNDNIFMDWSMDYENYKKQHVKSINPVRDFNNSDDLNASSVAVHSNLLQVLQKKVNDLQDTLKTLNLKFSNTMNENARLVELVKSKETAEITMKEDFKKLLDEELICNICTELYIKPITLGCSHTFCQHCIYEWKKKKRQCPMCRERIESETTVLFMDNFINKAVEQLDKASLEKRFELMKKREEIQILEKKPKRKKSKGRNSRRNEPVRPAVSVINERDDEVELLRSRISEIQSYTDDIQNYVDVIDELISERISDEDNAGYIGYGRCFNCGNIGHWAEECPY